MDSRTLADITGPVRAEPGAAVDAALRRPPLSARAAASELGVNERTVRRWIDQGQLAAHKVRGSYRIAPEEVERARIAILGEGFDDVARDVIDVDAAGADTSDVSGRARMSAAAAASVVPAAAIAQLDAIRDQWLQPMVDRIGELERENGALVERVGNREVTLSRLEAERDRIARERDELRVEVERLQSVTEVPVAAPAAPESPSPPASGAGCSDGCGGS